MGCLIASFDLILDKFDISRSMNGPPEAVIVKCIYFRPVVTFVIDPIFQDLNIALLVAVRYVHYQQVIIEALNFPKIFIIISAETSTSLFAITIVLSLFIALITGLDM